MWAGGGGGGGGGGQDVRLGVGWGDGGEEQDVRFLRKGEGQGVRLWGEVADVNRGLFHVQQVADVGHGVFDVRKTFEMSRATEFGPVVCFQ